MEQPQEEININPILGMEDLKHKNNDELIEITSKFHIMINMYNFVI